MQKPTEKQLDGMIRLVNIDEFKEFFKWLSDSYFNECKESTKIDKEPQRSWMQGRAQQLETIIRTVQNAQHALESMRAAGGRDSA